MGRLSEERLAALEGGAPLSPEEQRELLAELREAREEAARLRGDLTRWMELAASYQEETAELSSALHKLQREGKKSTP
jgi:hypothetical protein